MSHGTQAHRAWEEYDWRYKFSGTLVYTGKHRDPQGPCFRTDEEEDRLIELLDSHQKFDTIEVPRTVNIPNTQPVVPTISHIKETVMTATTTQGAFGKTGKSNDQGLSENASALFHRLTHQSQEADAEKSVHGRILEDMTRASAIKRQLVELCEGPNCERATLKERLNEAKLQLQEEGSLASEEEFQKAVEAERRFNKKVGMLKAEQAELTKRIVAENGYLAVFGVGVEKPTVDVNGKARRERVREMVSTLDAIDFLPDIDKKPELTEKEIRLLALAQGKKPEDVQTLWATHKRNTASKSAPAQPTK